ncbi:hypothetical protein [Streptomyces glomeratus]|uniref:Dihydrodipicolinate reductase N-terminal domain-containing protein n=1 Tax=Streptomyces glomeratus TaxID=284452 RepID=A0ABP6LIC2_9ACTN|nr:hypothetical protein [Streptomyces glomeratus]MCF1511922.1 hypothetical protein [Streptomyces glomeratus]
MVAVGRNRGSLDSLAAIDPRVVPAPLTGDRAVDGPAIRAAAGPVDAVVDTLGAVPSPESTMAGFDAIRPDGAGSSSAAYGTICPFRTATSCTVG